MIMPTEDAKVLRLVRPTVAPDALDCEIPTEADRLRYMLGGLTMFFLVVLVATGHYHARFHDPDPLAAHDSVADVFTRAPLDDWVRSLHCWSAASR